MPSAERAEFSVELLVEVLAESRAMRRALQCRGWGDTPALDAEIAALEGAIAAARSDCFRSDCSALNTQAPGSPGVVSPMRQILSDESPLGGGDDDEMTANPKKLTPELVAKIRALGRLARAGITNQRAIAAHFGLSQSTVSDVISGKLWPICPTTEWKPQVQLVDPNKVDAMAQRFGGRFAGPGGVVTLPASDDRTSLPDGDDVDAVSADDTTTESESAAQ